MCLIKKHTFPKKSSKPITVYKVLKLQENLLYPPYISYNGPVSIGEIYAGMDRYKNNHIVFRSIFKKEIEEGFIHSFNNLYTAREEAPYVDGKKVIVECEIPADTFYYEGQSCDLASRKLKYVKIIEEL